MVLSHRSMAALWLVGVEDRPERCGEICVTEVFGKDVDAGVSAEVGMGLHAFRDPALAEDFAAPRLPIDVAEMHDYAVDWDAQEARFSVDGQVVRRCPRPPTYPVQVMLAVFDFPEWSRGDDDHLVPELVVDRISS
jgi:beta-glucanase (GH16 family)